MTQLQCGTVQFLPTLLNLTAGQFAITGQIFRTHIGINTVGELISKTEEELLNLKNFGKKSYDEIQEKLKEVGLSFASEGTKQ